MATQDRVSLSAATEHQPRARAALTAALAAGPTHAYLFRGPPGSGKAAAARAFAAEILAAGSTDPESARRRALADPSPHPDLVWITPPGAWHLVDEIRESVIRAAALRPVEGDRRVFVIEAAEAMRDESQNALLKTLEEPAPFAHVILTCSEPELLTSTIASRCQPVDFVPLPPEAVIAQLGLEPSPEVEAVARLCAGNLDLARLLLTDEGREMRASAERAARAPRSGDGDFAESPWLPLLERSEAAGAEAGAEAERTLRERSGRAGNGARAPKLRRDEGEQLRRVERRARTEALDSGLGLVCGWYRDLAAVTGGANESVLNSDRRDELVVDAEGLAPERARAALELVLDTRRRLRLNVAEELALDALWLRLGEVLRT